MDDLEYDGEGQEEEQPISQGSREDFNTIANKLKNTKTGQKVGNKINETASSAKDKLKNSQAGQAVKNGANNLLKNSKYGKAIGKAAEVGKKAKDGADTVKDGVEKAKEIKDEIVKQVRSKAIETAGNAIAPGMGKIIAKADEIKNAVDKKINDKIKQETGIDVKKTKKLLLISLILFPFFLFFIIITAGAQLFTSERTYTDLKEIIIKRETRYNKPLIYMTNTEMNEIMTRDFDMNSDIKDISYRTFLKDSQKQDLDNYMPTDETNGATEEEKKNNAYVVKETYVKDYLKASRYNFNKINWSFKGNVFSGVSGLFNNLLIGADFDDTDALNIPNLAYRSDNMSEEQMKNVYLNLFNQYVQHFIVPYSLNIASQDNEFGNNVLKDMWCPIDATLYSLETKTEYSCGLAGSSTTKLDYVPVITYTESMYKVIKREYKIKKEVTTKNEAHSHYSEGPDGEVIETKCNYTVKTTKDILEIDESNSYEKDYKLSYMNPGNPDDSTVPNDYKGINRDISRIEWYLDTKSGSHEMYPTKTQSQIDYVKNKYMTTDDKIKAHTYDEMQFGYMQIAEFYKFIRENPNTNGMLGAKGTINIGNVPAGGFTWPVPILVVNGFTKTKAITQKFMNTSSMYSRGFHSGTDIGNHGYSNIQIVSMQSGKVVSVFKNHSAYGNSIFIDHGNGYYTRYSHLASFSKEFAVGESIANGQVLGIMGTTGKSTGVHLDLEMYSGGTSFGFGSDIGNLIDMALFFNEDLSPVISSGSTQQFGNLPIGENVPSSTYNAAMKYFPFVEKWANKYGLDPYLVIAMICTESSGNPNSFNGSAKGLMQIEKVYWDNTIKAVYADGSSEILNVDSSKLFDPDYNIKIGCAELKNRIIDSYNNIAVAIQGYNYGSAGIKRCITHHMSGGVGTGTYFGVSNTDYIEYVKSGNIDWTSSRAWYSSTGHTAFAGAGGGTPNHLEKVLSFYNGVNLTKEGAGNDTVFEKYRQGSPYWGSLFYAGSDKWSTGACGPTSIATIMTMKKLVIPEYDGISRNISGNTINSPKDGIMDPFEIGVYANENGGHASGTAAMSWSFPTQVLKNKLGYTEKQTSNSNEALNYLKQGYVGVMSVGAGYFTSGGHIMAVVGYDGDKIKIHDVNKESRDGAFTISELNGDINRTNGVSGSTKANVRMYFLYKSN